MLTIAYFTSRKDCRIEWFFRSLARELRNSITEVEIIIVDFHACEEGRKEYIFNEFKILGLTENSIRHVDPKPCHWQGKYKKTKEEWFAPSNARNTAFALCRTNFIACVDDLSVLMPGWLDQVKHAQQHDYVVLGAYKKVLNLSVDESGFSTFNDYAKGVDSRWGNGNDSGIVKAGGSWLYGCSFALPMSFVIKVNGMEEMCDSVGLEDCEFGARLERAGAKFFYNRNMLTIESEELHFSEGNKCFKRNDRKTKSGINADWHLLNNCVKGSHIRSKGNEFSIELLKSMNIKGENFPIPTTDRDWATGKLLTEL